MVAGVDSQRGDRVVIVERDSVAGGDSQVRGIDRAQSPGADRIPGNNRDQIGRVDGLIDDDLPGRVERLKPQFHATVARGAVDGAVDENVARACDHLEQVHAFGSVHVLDDVDRPSVSTCVVQELRSAKPLGQSDVADGYHPGAAGGVADNHLLEARADGGQVGVGQVHRSKYSWR